MEIFDIMMLPPLSGCVRLASRISCCRRRFRRRGPRSTEALQRRALRFDCRRSEEADAGKSTVEPPFHEFDMQPLCILNCNIRSLMGKLAELMILLELFSVNLLCVQEFWLDASTPYPLIPNFSMIPRGGRKKDADSWRCHHFCP